MDDDDSWQPKWGLGIIIVLLGAIVFLLADIAGTLDDIYSDTHYTSASADYLKNIENILEDIRNK